MRTAHKLELTGMIFDRWTVIHHAYIGNRGVHYWLCRCSCGVERAVKASSLTDGVSKSCGCYHKERVTNHGMTGLPTFKSWESMKQRCTNPKAPDYARYGGRGITVCERWINSFDSFVADMGMRPKGTTLDRIDNGKGYSPENCRWATPKEQMRNRRNTVKIMLDGEPQSICDISEKYNIPEKLIRDRVSAGWDIHRILNTPNRKRNHTLN